MAKTPAEATRAEIYLHKPLNRGTESFRFITILPSDDDDQMVRCMLETQELVEGFRYAALSYVWGDPWDTENIVVDSQILPVTKNLASALWHFRKFGIPQNQQTGPLSRLWVDAISINQNDEDERSHQVAKMGSLYKKATSVTSWLGPPGPGGLEIVLGRSALDYYKCRENTVKRYVGDSGVDILLQIISSVASVFKVSPGCMTRYGEIDPERGLEAFQQLYFTLGPCAVRDPDGSGLLFSDKWLPLYLLAECKYWSRLWIVQEMVLARSPSVHLFTCGVYNITMEELWLFCLLIDFLKNTSIPSCFGLDSTERITWMSLSGTLEDAPGLGLILDMRERILGGGNNPEEPDLIHQPGIKCASTTSLNPEIKTSITANQPTSRPSFDHKKIRPSVAEIGQRLKSNVCNEAAKYTLFSHVIRIALVTSASNPRDFVYGVLGLVDTTIKPDYQKSVRDIYLEAFLHDAELNVEICLLFSGSGIKSPDSHLLPSWLPDLSKLHQNRFKFSTKFNNNIQCLSTNTEGYQPFKITKNNFRISGVIAEIMEWFESDSDTKVPDFQDNRSITIDLKAMKRSGLDIAVESMVSLIRRCCNKAIFRTTEGRLGIGPLYLHPGDRICVVDRVSLPISRRKTQLQIGDSSYFEHVGPCFVTGLSQGEPAEMGRVLSRRN
ncbi:hypothetical protein M426DRAFT_258867 [Hypoxylon sp. CI-4A]|nr:hypothetical protein M426DRAFT_258867 [Hypoxylon sp. CI-4A]